MIIEFKRVANHHRWTTILERHFNKKGGPDTRRVDVIPSLRLTTAVVVLDGWPKLFDVLLLKLCTRKQLRLAKLGYSAKGHSHNMTEVHELSSLDGKKKQKKKNKIQPKSIT